MKPTIEKNSITRESVSCPIPLRSLAACAMLLATTALAPADVTLKGNVGPRVIEDDVIIARGTTCVLNGTTIKGNVRVRSGAKLYANGAWVDGSIFANNSKLVDLRDSTRVTWNVRGNGTRSILLQDDCHVGGHVQLQEGSPMKGMDALLVRNSTVVGNVQAENSTGRVLIKFSTIEGKLKIANNTVGKFVMRGNEVYNDIRYLYNSGNGFIVDNTVGGNLKSTGNTPLPTVRNNRVRGNTTLE